MKRFLALSILICIPCYWAQFLQDDPNYPQSSPYTCTTTTHCESGKDIAKKSQVSGNRGPTGSRGPPGPRGSKGDKGDPCQCKTADKDPELAELRKALMEAKEEFQDIRQDLQIFKELTFSFPTNCSSYNAIEKKLMDFSAVPIYPRKDESDLIPAIVNCDVTDLSSKEEWIVIQRRMDGSVDFFRNWESYARGFGKLNGEFWIGLRTLHSLTAKQNHKLRIDFRTWEGEKVHVEYSSFHIGTESANFNLTIGGFTGNTADKLAYHNGQPFSTFDRDNDENLKTNCAKISKGAWWYKNCFHSSLNGRYIKARSRSGEGIRWKSYPNSLVFTEMKIKPN